VTPDPIGPAAAGRLQASLDLLFHRNLHAVKLGLETAAELLRDLGNPQDAMLAIHVAGTNGKGSVCAMIGSILRRAGLRTGLYTSPHLVRFNERVRVDGAEVGDAELAALLDATEAAAGRMRARTGGRDATFFEFTTALALEHFRRRGVRMAVLETGMGGRLDATNVVQPLVSVITSIALDHAPYLGETVAQIAFEKAGIIKPGRPVVCGDLPEDAAEVVARTARERGSPLHLARDLVRVARKRQTLDGQVVAIETGGGPLPPLTLPLLGPHQLANCALAVAVVDHVRESCGLSIPDEAIREGLAATDWPGRCHVVSRDPPVLLDGAHNPDAAAALRKALAELGGGRPLGLVVSFLADKDAAGFMKVFAGKAARCWAVQARSERAMPLGDIVAHAASCGIAAEPGTLPEALRAAAAWAAEHRGIVCVTGSLYLVGEALAARCGA
jgi:dihydrofolate synthase/folylpolyglutamate synthase